MKRGRYKHFLDALKGKFFGYPDGIFVNSVEVEDYLPFQGKSWTYDLLTGHLLNLECDISPQNKFLKVLDACHYWFANEIAKEQLTSTDLSSATFEFTVGYPYCADRSAGLVSQLGDVYRDSGGRAVSDMIPLAIPEWKETLHIKFGMRIGLVTPNRTYLHEESDIELMFLKNRLK